MKGLTKKQSEIIDYLNDFIQTHHYSPSFREIMQHFGFTSPGTVYRYVNILKRKGFISTEKRCSRSISVSVKPGNPANSGETFLPFIGTVSSSAPIQMFSYSQSVSIPSHLIQAPDRTYVLRVLGEGWIEELIADGDLLLIEARPEAHAGETIIALVNQHDIIVRRYYPEGDYVRLIGSNPHHQPMIIRHEDLEIQGILVGLIRRFG